MKCPKCNADSRVTDSRTKDGTTRRTRICFGGHSFLTSSVNGEPEIVKRKAIAAWIKNRLPKKTRKPVS